MLRSISGFAVRQVKAFAHSQLRNRDNMKEASKVPRL
jgi:hypothetical protein